MASKTFSSIAGGGGSNIIGSVEPKNVTTLFHTGEDASVWVKTGYLEPDTASYPNAPINIGSITGLSNGFDTSVELTNTQGVSYDPVSEVFYILEGNVLYKYDSSGVFISATADLTASSPMASVTAFVVYDNLIYAMELGVIYSFNTVGAYQETLANIFDFTILDGASTMAYDNETNSFFTTQTNGLGGAVSIRYVNQTTGDAGILGSTANISGYSPNGLAIAYGKIYLSTYNSGADTNRIYSGKYTGPTTQSWTENLDFTLTTSPYDGLYGLTIKDGVIISSSRTTDTTVNVSANIGVGVPEATSVNNEGNIFYYCKIK